MKHPWQRVWWRISPNHRLDTHPARVEEVFGTELGAGDRSTYHKLAKQLVRSRPHEAAELMLLRADTGKEKVLGGEQQLRAYEAYLLASNLISTRRAVIMAALSLPTVLAAALIS